MSTSNSSITAAAAGDFDGLPGVGLLGSTVVYAKRANGAFASTDLGNGDPESSWIDRAGHVHIVTARYADGQPIKAGSTLNVSYKTNLSGSWVETALGSVTSGTAFGGIEADVGADIYFDDDAGTAHVFFNQTVGNTTTPAYVTVTGGKVSAALNPLGSLQPIDPYPSRYNLTHTFFKTSGGAIAFVRTTKNGQSNELTFGVFAQGAFTLQNIASACGNQTWNTLIATSDGHPWLVASQFPSSTLGAASEPFTMTACTYDGTTWSSHRLFSDDKTMVSAGVIETNEPVSYAMDGAGHLHFLFTASSEPNGLGFVRAISGVYDGAQAHTTVVGSALDQLYLASPLHMDAAGHDYFLFVPYCSTQIPDLVMASTVGGDWQLKRLTNPKWCALDSESLSFDVFLPK